MGSWNQEGAKEKFFNGGYSSYLMSGSVKEFEEKDWYIFELTIKEYSDYDVIFVIRLNTIKEDYSSFMSQFVLNTNNYEHLLLQKRIFFKRISGRKVLGVTSHKRRIIKEKNM